jgi:putative transposase
VLVAYDRLFGLELEHLAVDGCITKAPCGGQVAGPSPVDRRKQGLKRSVAVEAGGIPLAVLAAPANHRDDGLLAAILDAAATVTTAAVGPMPRTLTVHLDAGYDWKPCRQILTERGMAAEIATRGVPAPIQAGRRWVIERTHAWANQYGKLRWCTERHRLVVEFWLALALAVLVCGRRLVVRNGHARQRQVMTAAGAILVRAPRVDDRRTDLVTGQRIRFRSVRLPPWCRKSPKVAEVLPLLYLHGLSTGDFAPALAAFFGSAAGLSAAAIGRLLGAWQADDQAFCQRDLAERDYVDLWADGLHFRSVWSRPTCAVWCWWACAPTAPRNWSRSPTESASRPSRGRSCWGICAAAGCGRRWSRSATARWACGPPCAMSSQPPASSATGSTSSPMCSTPCPTASTPARGRRWRDPGCPRPRPRRARRRAVRPRLRRQVAQGGGQDHRRRRGAAHVLRFPGRALGAPEDQQSDESTFSTVRLRTRVTKGPGSKAAGLAMAFKLLEAAQDRWRAVNGPHLVALVRAGARFDKGVIIERPDEPVQEVAA